jgi:hypothetical protein
MVAIIVGLLGLAVIWQEGSLQDEKEIKALIEKLGDDDFKARESATEKLINIGKKAFPYLEEAKGHKDPEVKSRAEYIIEEIKNKDMELVKKYIKDHLKNRYLIDHERLKGEYIEKHLPGCQIFMAREILVRPSSWIVLGVDEEDKVFEIKKPHDLKKYLRPVKGEEDAKEVSSVLARLVGLCRYCPDVEISPDIFSVEKKNGVFEVKGGLEYHGNYNWKFTFDKHGKLKKMEREGPGHAHQ